MIEPSAGADRGTLAFLCEAYHEDQAPDDKGDMQTRTVMKFHPRIAPVKAAVFPLVKKDGMPEAAKEIYTALKKRFVTFYDEKGAVGRRYRRQDEAGTPYCITVDGQTLQDGTVTIRDRDSLEQWRSEESGRGGREKCETQGINGDLLPCADWACNAFAEDVGHISLPLLSPLPIASPIDRPGP